MQLKTSRRMFLTGATAGAGALALPPVSSAATPSQPQADSRFRYALNTGTIRGYKLPLAEQIDLASRAGYTGIEPWTADLAKAAETDGKLKELARRCADSGLAVINAIGFAGWAMNDDAARANGLEQMKRDMDLVAQMGGTHIAASPAGVNRPNAALLDLDRAAERYRAVLELGRTMGVIPQLEFWGASANLSRLDECLYVAARASHPDACILTDVFHLYKGGTAPASLRLLGRSAAYTLHMNDYPAQPPRETVKDADRIWPGDGIAPIRDILQAYLANRADLWLSVELFNAEYWKRPADETARTGLDKMRAVVASAVKKPV
jgi:sugar phosphate isomerase/epimerase